MGKTISTLTDYAVARLLLRKLWQLQDASGVSMGRAKRNVLLEGAIYIMPLLRFRGQDQFGRDQLIDEAMRRTESSLPLRSAVGERKVPHMVIAVILLYHMREWYEADAQKDPMQALRLEMEILDASLRLLPKPSPEQVTERQIEDLVEDANDRRRYLLRRRYQRA